MRRILLIPVMLFFYILTLPHQGMAQPQINSETAILMDMKTGQVLYEKDADKIMYPASTTKILTTLIALKKGELNDRVVISHNAASAEGSAVGLQEGEILVLRDLLYAVMLSSANDAALAVAEHIGGSQEGFAQLMNSEARALGATSSNFVTPNGLHHPNHYTTARDMALIAQKAMENSYFREIVKTFSHRVKRNLPKPVNGIPQEDFTNLNRLVWPNSMYSYFGATGIKTGFTNEAGNCLVAGAQREGREYLTVVMNTDRNGIYVDSAALLNYAFEGFTQVLLAQKNVEQGFVTVKRGDIDTVGAVIAEDYNYNVPVGLADSPVEKKVQLVEKLEAPLIRGQKVGVMTFFMDGKEISKIDLLSDGNIQREPMVSWWHGAVFAGFMLMVTRSWAKAKARRRSYYHARRKRYYQEYW